MIRLRDWRVKALVQDILSASPGGCRLNDWLQRHVGGLRNFEDNICRKVTDWCQVSSYLKAVGCKSLTEQTIVEVGSGWYPTLPICFALAGARRIYTVDLNRHMNEGMSLRMLRAVEPHLDRIASSCGLPASEARRRWEVLCTSDNLAQLLNKANIEYRAPADARDMGWLDNGCIDLAYSNSVLEHVLPSALPGIMKELWRVLRPDGLMLHAVACNDHYTHFDKSVSPINYLRFTERQWRWFNNDLNYQNRLRPSSFLSAARDSGFDVIHEARTLRPRNLDTLQGMRLAPQFKSFDPEDLATTSIDFVSIKRQYAQ